LGTHERELTRDIPVGAWRCSLGRRRDRGGPGEDFEVGRLQLYGARRTGVAAYCGANKRIPHVGDGFPLTAARVPEGTQPCAGLSPLEFAPRSGGVTRPVADQDVQVVTSGTWGEEGPSGQQGECIPARDRLPPLPSKLIRDARQQSGGEEGGERPNEQPVEQAQPEAIPRGF